MAEKASSIIALRSLVSDFEDSEQEAELYLRLSLTRLVLSALSDRGWNQSRLAEKVGCSRPFLSRLLHGDENWTAKTAAKVAFALGLRLELAPVRPVAVSTPGTLRYIHEDGTRGEEYTTQEEVTAGQTSTIVIAQAGDDRHGLSRGIL